MRIALDARLNAYRGGGIPNYTRQLLTAMAALAPDDEFIALQHRRQLRPLVLAPNVRRVGLFTPPHNRFEQLALPLELLPHRPQLLHCPDFIAPRMRLCPAVVTIHDLAFIHYPAILDDDARRYYGQVRAAAHHADALIAVSQSTHDDIVAQLGVPPERITVIYEAAAPIFQPLALEAGQTRSIGGHELSAGSFLLFVSTLEPRKNLPTLLQALAICRERLPSAHVRLAVAGARGWHENTIFKIVKELKLEEAVLFLGRVETEELRWLYNACRIYINPSLYEGFGLPVLEALACGAPTLIAATSSLPEIAGDAAIAVPPLASDAWADAILALWHDEQRRSKLAQLGPAQAGRFSWQRAARETLALYRRVAERNRRGH
jgi:glycosyltransferase involved in cell wall biosynthesis